MTIKETWWVHSLARWCVARMETSLAGDSLTFENYGLMSRNTYSAYKPSYARTGRGGRRVSGSQTKTKITTICRFLRALRAKQSLIRRASHALFARIG